MNPLLPRWPVRAAAGLIVAAAGCAPSASLIELAPITPEATGEVHPGRIVWYDLVTDDIGSAKSFYGGLFGWSFEDVPGGAGGYSVIELDGRPIGGMVPIEDEDPAVSSARWLSLMSVEDVEAAAGEVRTSGGSVVLGPREDAQRGHMALVRDPEGALLVLIRAAGGDPPDRAVDEVGAGDWLWTELWAHDAASAADFYASLVGYSVVRPELDVHEAYRVFQRDGRPRAGVNQLPWDEVQSNWVPYVRVVDAVAVARRAEELGGRVLIAPDADIRDGTAALIMDPTGAAFAVQKWPVEGERTPGMPDAGGRR